jgi:hypothetical protein
MNNRISAPRPPATITDPVHGPAPLVHNAVARRSAGLPASHKARDDDQTGIYHRQ